MFVRPGAYHNKNLQVLHSTRLQLWFRLIRLATDKHSSLFGLFDRDKENKLNVIDTLHQHKKHFFSASLTLWKNKLECLFLESLFSMVC